MKDNILTINTDRLWIMGDNTTNMSLKVWGSIRDFWFQYSNTANTPKGIHCWKKFSEMFIKFLKIIIKKTMLPLIYLFSKFKYLHILYEIIFWKVVH